MARAWASVLCRIGLAALVGPVGGCGGGYILSVPDQLAPAGGEAVAVARLQRREFYVWALPVKDAAVRFQVGDGPQRGAYTDELGYAGAAVPVPAEPGRHTLTVAHLDLWGDEVAVTRPVHVWPADSAAVAVDLDCLPGLWLGGGGGAAKALGQIAASARLLYLTRRAVHDHDLLRRQLARAGYPDGPILLWRREDWHIVREGQFNLPRVVIESRLVGQLAHVRKSFPGLSAGVCDSALAARAFAEAGLKCVVVGGASGPPGAVRRESWADLAAKGL